jgi:hypothetical protein
MQIMEDYNVVIHTKSQAFHVCACVCVCVYIHTHTHTHTHTQVWSFAAAYHILLDLCLMLMSGGRIALCFCALPRKLLNTRLRRSVCIHSNLRFKLLDKSLRKN